MSSRVEAWMAGALLVLGLVLIGATIWTWGHNESRVVTGIIGVSSVAMVGWWLYERRA